jgi:hypothetical protein
MSWRACGTVSAGTFFEQGLQSDQEQVGQARLRHMMMPAGPGARFIVIQSDFTFGFFQHRLHRPAPTAQAHQVQWRTGGRRVAQVVFDFRLQPQAASNDQPDPRPRQAIPHDRDPLECKRRDHRPATAFLNGVASPAACRQVTQPIPHRRWPRRVWRDARLRSRLPQRAWPLPTQPRGPQPDARRGRRFGEVPLAQRRYPVQKAWILDTVARLQGVERPESEVSVDFRYGQRYQTQVETRAGRVSA